MGARTFLVALVLVALVACGGVTNIDGNPTDASSAADGTSPRPPREGGTDAGADVDNGAPSDTYPVPHPPQPQLVHLGGAVAAKPRVVPIVYATDGYAQQLAAFFAALPQSKWWGDVTAEYGVGALTALPPVVLPGPAPATLDDKQIQALLASLVQAGTLPPPDGDTIYEVLPPQTTQVTYTQLQKVLKSCVDFWGYHLEMPIDGGGKAAYAVVPRCPYLWGMSGLPVLTSIASRELVNAATDPFPLSAPAWSDVDDDHAIWSYVPGAGVASMCGWERQSYAALVGTWTVTKGWSNASAKADHDPCAPASPPYFAASPLFPDTVTYAIEGYSARSTKGLRVPVGQTKTVDVVLWSDGPVGPWSVYAQDMDEIVSGTSSLELVWDRTSGKNGEKLHLTITALRKGRQGGGTEIVIWSQLGNVSRGQFGFVAN